MSYILDALRKADSERERGAIPSIHAQPVPLVSDDAPPAGATAWLKWVMAGLFIVLLAALAWLLLERGSQNELVAAAPQIGSVEPRLPVAPVAVTPAIAATPQAAPPPAAQPTAPTAALPMPPPDVKPAPIAPPVAMSPVAAAPPEPKHEAPRTVAKKTAPVAVAKTSGRKPGQVEPAEDKAAAGGPIYQLKDLPEGVRRELPNLPIGGSIHSKSAADRLLIIHGQLFHEGDTLAPGLVLEQIRLKSAVLSFKGYRYEVTF